MKQSELLYLAQVSVVTDFSLTADERLKIIAALMEEEKSAKFHEKWEEEHNGKSV